MESHGREPSGQLAGSSDTNLDLRERQDKPSQFFQFRRWEPGGSVAFGDIDIPDFNLASVTEALSRGWVPNTEWTEDELVFPPSNAGCVAPSACDPWCHFNTPIHRALFPHEQFDVAELLLAHGADINQLNALGRTVLHEALDLGIDPFNDYWTEKATWIIKHGADLDKKTEARTVVVAKHQHSESFKTDGYSRPGGVSPLMMVMQLANLDKVQHLVDAGANVNLPLGDEGGWRPLDLALLSGQLNMIEVLKKAGACFSVELAEGRKVEPKLPNIGKGQLQARLREGAEDLLSFCVTRSLQCLPGPECESIYRYIFETDESRSVWRSQDGWNGLERYKCLSDILFRVLSSIARTRNPYLVPKSFCALCRNLITHFREKVTGEICQHATSLAALEQAVENSSCPLCDMLLDAIEHNFDKDFEIRRPTNSIKGEKSPVEVWIDRRYRELRVQCGDRTSGLPLRHLDDDLLYDLLDYSDDSERGTGSPRAFALGRAWIDRCKKNHPKCQRPQDLTDPILPTRVLDISSGPETRPMVRLIETLGLMNGAYCALSYCWGKSQGTTTTKENLERQKVDIPIDSLPATIRDAIIAARSLGFQYLWIDSFCIVQDDADDWDSETEKMCNIYADATLTISTLVGDNLGEGLFKPRTFRQSTPLPFPLVEPSWYFGNSRVLSLAVQPPAKRSGRYKHCPGYKFRGPIHSRGWTCQEHVLSTRILWYEDGHMQWECVGMYAADESPDGISFQSHYLGESALAATKAKEHIHRAIWANTIAQLKKEESDVEDDSAFEYRNSNLLVEWEKLVAEYSKRNLSVQTDRIPAILGLARSVGLSLGCEFVAGAWKGEHFLRSLLWRVVDPSSLKQVTTTLPYPSWTWASKADTAVDYKLAQDLGKRPITWLASVLSLDVSLKGKSQAAASGSVSIRGPFGSMTPSEADELIGSKAGTSFWKPKYYPDMAGPRSGDLWYLDTKKLGQGKPYRGYGYPRWPGGMPGATVRIFLEPVDDKDTPNIFRRIGIGSINRAAKSVAVRDIVII